MPLTASNAVIVNHSYDGYGNLTSTQNANGYTTKLTYDTTWNLSVTKVQQATEDTTNTRTFIFTVDSGASPPPTGLMTSAKDNDHSVLHSYSYDQFGRSSSINDASIRNTSLAYSDSARRVVTTTDVYSGDNGNRSAVWYDQLGRVRLTNQMQTATDDPTLPASGIQVQTRYMSSATGLASYQLVSNPYVTGSEPTAGWTLTTLDTMGRPVSIAHYTGQTLPAPWGSNGGITGTATFSYSGNCTTATDEAGVARTSCVDGYGRLKTVHENGINGTTTYTFDAFGNLWQVVPASGNTRSFSYSSLSRMVYAGNPETTQESYGYDHNGNLVTRTDNRIVSGTTYFSTVYSYDGLDNLTEKIYSDYSSSSPTPWPSYYYSKGWLTRTYVGGTGNTEVDYGAFDGLGRPTSVTQNTQGSSFPFTVAYTASDEISSVTNPWGRTITTTYDPVGRVSGVAGSLNGQNTAYAGTFTYAPHGAVTGMTSGDGVVHGAAYNAQLQPSGITATGLLSGASANLLSLTLGYSGSGNNGNVVSQQIQRQYLTTTLQTFNATDNYSYTDSMNRLNGASESGVWADSYVYDCMSNRAVTASSTSVSLTSNFTPQTSSTSSCVVGGASPSVPFDANNRWTAASYDAAGDMTGVSTQTMQYDAERRLTKLTDTGTPATTVVYGYDADGRRVVKTTSAGTTIYVYGPDGELAGESSTIPSATIAGTEYVTADHLGSTRLTTDSQGSPLGCHDYLPFGQEIPGSWGRSSVPCYSPAAADTDQKFTGQVRDSDTSPGLDQFNYRYLSGPQGRFVSPDAAGVMLADLGNPQSWNMYS